MIHDLKKTRMTMRKDVFDDFARQLMGRGFVDRLPLNNVNLAATMEEPLEIRKGNLALEDHGVEVSVRGAVPIHCLSELTREMNSDTEVLVGAMLRTGWHRNFNMLLSAFEEKALGKEGNVGRMDLVASLVMVTDPDALVKRALAVGAMLGRLRDDKAPQFALDALELSKKLAAVPDEIPESNMYRQDVMAKMQALAEGYRKRYTEVERGMRSDAVIRAAMELIA